MPVEVEVPDSVTPEAGMPLSKLKRYFFLSRLTSASNLNDRKFTQEAPTPCKPPDAS